MKFFVGFAVLVGIFFVTLYGVTNLLQMVDLNAIQEGRWECNLVGSVAQVNDEFDSAFFECSDGNRLIISRGM